MKLDDVKPKHLVLGQEYDDFSKATDKVDFSKEDLCCQVVGLTAVYYWINTESVWGPLGFIWDEYNNYGHFGVSTLDFTVIPKIPDSYRHQKLQYIFRNINRNITFLDSGWNHITLFSLYITYLVDWYLDLNDDNQHTINGVSSVKLHGCNKNTFIDPCNIFLIPENKNHLDINILTNRGNNSTSLYGDEITEDCITDGVLDLRDYVHIYKIETNDFERKLYVTVSKNITIKKLIVELGNIIHRSGFDDEYSMGITTNNIATKDNPLENITYILRPDLIIEHYQTDDVQIEVFNSNSIYTKTVTYKNIENLIFNKISVYYSHCLFINGTPEITQEMIDFTRLGIFDYCVFYQPYQYGKVKCISRIFYQQNELTYDSKEIYLYDYNFYYNRPEVSSRNDYIIKFTDLFEFEYTEEDYNEAIYFPKDTTTDTTYTFYDLKLPKLFISFKTNLNVTTSKGDIEYSNVELTRLYIPNSGYNIIINNNVIFKIGMGNEKGDIFGESQNGYIGNFIIKTTKDNITENKTTYNNAYLCYWSHRVGNKPIPYIIRYSNTAFEIVTESDYVNQSMFIPQVGWETILYHIAIDFTYKKQMISNDRVQWILNNIVTVGDINDASGLTIKLLSEYYQSMKEETKSRLISDGYTIIEVL